MACNPSTKCPWELASGFRPELAPGLTVEFVTKQLDARSWDAELASAASRAGWKLAGGGTIYRSTDLYVFELRAPAPREGHSQRGSVLAKPLALDPVFWEIVGSSELLRKRLAFRVNGAFTVPLFNVGDITYTIESEPARVVEDLNSRFLQMESGLRTLEDFQPWIEARDPPRSGRDLTTCLTWSIVVGRHDEARRLLRAAITSGLDGGVSFPAGTFEDLALDHLGMEDERGHHVELIDGRFRRIFPGARWTASERLVMDLSRMNGAKRFALALWRLPRAADRRLLDDRWDADNYIQCAGGPDQFVIEVRRPTGDELEQLVVGHPDTDPSVMVDVRRGEHVSNLHAGETFTRDEVFEIMLHYIEHEAIPSGLASRRLEPLPGQSTELGGARQKNSS